MYIHKCFLTTIRNSLDGVKKKGSEEYMFVSEIQDAELKKNI